MNQVIEDDDCGRRCPYRWILASHLTFLALAGGRRPKHLVERQGSAGSSLTRDQYGQHADRGQLKRWFLSDYNERKSQVNCVGKLTKQNNHNKIL